MNMIGASVSLAHGAWVCSPMETPQEIRPGGFLAPADDDPLQILSFPLTLNVQIGISVKSNALLSPKAPVAQLDRAADF